MDTRYEVGAGPLSIERIELDMEEEQGGENRLGGRNRVEKGKGG
jgi:hypothetical protein